MEDVTVAGLSIANNLLANAVLFTLNKNQGALEHVTKQLSSGLRITSGGDDPSGYAIATDLQTKVLAYDQAASNLQGAANAATVADAALSATTQILQRIRNLAVEAATDISSDKDRAAIQGEISQLLIEVNRIAQNTAFNGTRLLDGSHAGFQPDQNAFVTVSGNTSLASNGNVATVNGVNYGFLVATVTATASGNFATTAGNVQGYNGAGSYATVDGTIELRVVNTGASIGVQETFINAATSAISVDSTLFGARAVSADFENVSITLGAFSTADVGVAAYVKVSQNVAALTNPSDAALVIQSGAAEGDVVQIALRASNTQTLRISNLNVAITSLNTSPSIGAEDAIGQIDNALQSLLNERAQLGAIIERLNHDADNNNLAATNLQSAESNVRDLNVSEATTQFTKLQLLVRVGTSLLAQANLDPAMVIGLIRSS